MATTKLPAARAEREAFRTFRLTVKRIAPELLAPFQHVAERNAAGERISRPLDAALRASSLARVPGFAEWASVVVRVWSRQPEARTKMHFAEESGDINPLLRTKWLTSPVRLDPKVVELPPAALPREETKAEYLERAAAHYDAQSSVNDVVYESRERQRQAEWFVRREIQGWSLARTAKADARTVKPTPKDISSGVAAFARKLGMTLARQRGRPRS